MASRPPSLNNKPALWCLTVALLVICPGVQVARAEPSLTNSQQFLALVAADTKAGLISYEESILIRFQYGFAPGDLPPRYTVTTFSPLRCGTSLIHEFYGERSRLSRPTVRQIDAWLTPQRDKAQVLELFTSASGRFTLSYTTSGVDAVPSTDTDPANGVPDYVDHIAQYFDESWLVEIEESGFTAPPLVGGTYQITFKSMQFYGYTAIVNVAARTTRIVMHNSYVGFPGNDDPDGLVAGASRVTAAHEFKHASQFAATGWAEGGWGELDATWAEELVFDQVNDYHNYLTGESPLRRPDLPLDGGSNVTGSYEDCVWQIWLSESFGVSLIQEFWQRRSTLPSEPVMESYRFVLNNHSVSLADGWAAFTAWNYGVSGRAVTGVGYQEAAAYPSGPLLDVSTSFPYNISSSLDHLAAQFVRLAGFSAASDEALRVVFDGQAGSANLTLAIFTEKRDGTGLVEIVALDEANQADHELVTPVSDLISVGLIVGNASTSGLSAPWNLQVDLVTIPLQSRLVLDSSSVQAVVNQLQVEQVTVQVSNGGEVGSLLDFTAQVWTKNPTDLSSSPKSVTGSAVTLSATSYLPGSLRNLDFRVDNASDDDEWLTDVEVQFPTGVSVLVSSDFVGGTRGNLVTDNSLGDGVNVTWHGVYGNQEYGVLRDGETAYGTVQVFITSSFSGDLVLDWTLAGDRYGAPPHQVVGQIVLSEGSPSFTIDSPAGGEVYQANETVSVTWSTNGVVLDIDVEFSRDAGVSWEGLASGLPNNGSAEVVLPGPAANNCLLRISAADGSVSAQTDGTFFIYETPTWISVTGVAGTLQTDESQNIVLQFSSAELALGSYWAWLVLQDTGTDTRTILPLTMTVESERDAATPRTFVLHGAFPNPFNPTTTVAFDLSTSAATTIDVLDLKGRLVRQLFAGDLPAGSQFEPWDGRDGRGRNVSAGVYVIRVRAGVETGTIKVVLTK